MAWSSPRTWVTGELVTASIGNLHWRDQFSFLHDNPWMFIGGGSGTSSNGSATTVATVSLSGLSRLDTLMVTYVMECTQDTGNVHLYNATDAVAAVSLSAGSTFAASVPLGGRAFMGVRQGSATLIRSWADGYGSGRADAGSNATWVTEWTNSWTLGLRHNGVTSSGTFYYRWSVHRLAGQ